MTEDKIQISTGSLIVWLVLNLIWFGWTSVAHIVAGAHWLDALCNKDLDIYLLVAGCTQILMFITTLIVSLNKFDRVDDGPLVSVSNVVNYIIALFSFGWWIYGCVIVSKSGVDKCIPELYKFALASVIIQMTGVILFGLLIYCFVFKR